MNELQTPIEIMLGIDGKGMTTARNLYEFLGLAKGQFSRWCKLNIVGNAFAEEGTDYIGFDIDVEGNEVRDYKLTAAFAKKLSMTAKNSKGEEAREYFVRAENKLKETAVQTASLSPELQMFQSIFNAVAQQEIRTKQLEAKADKAIETAQSIRESVIEEYDDWRRDINHKVGSIQKGMNKGYQETWTELYEALEKRAHCDLSTRVNNGRFRLREAGAKKSTIDAYVRLDVIETDPRLKEIFTAIVKEYAIKYVA